MIDDYTLGALLALTVLGAAFCFLCVWIAATWSQRRCRLGPISCGPGNGGRLQAIGGLLALAPLALIELAYLADAIGIYSPGSPVAARAAEAVQLLILVGFVFYVLRWIRLGRSE